MEYGWKIITPCYHLRMRYINDSVYSLPQVSSPSGRADSRTKYPRNKIGYRVLGIFIFSIGEKRLNFPANHEANEVLLSWTEYKFFLLYWGTDRESKFKKIQLMLQQSQRKWYGASSSIQSLLTSYLAPPLYYSNTDPSTHQVGNDGSEIGSAVVRFSILGAAAELC